MVMELRPIKTELDYQNALKEIEILFDAEPNSPEYDRLDILYFNYISRSLRKKNIIPSNHPTLLRQYCII